MASMGTSWPPASRSRSPMTAATSRTPSPRKRYSTTSIGAASRASGWRQSPSCRSGCLSPVAGPAERRAPQQSEASPSARVGVGYLRPVQWTNDGPAEL